MNIVSINKFKANKGVLIFFALSIAIHLSISIVHIAQNPVMTFNKSNPEPTQKILIKLLNTKIQKQIVASEESKIKDLSRVKKSVMLSKSNNFFERETQAVNGQKFKHAGIGEKNGVNKKTLTKKKQELSEKLKNIKFTDLGLKSKKVDLKKHKKRLSQNSRVKKGLKSGSSKLSGLGSTSDHLDNVPLGDFTKLNTQEYEYYGFYNRIRQKLEQFWGFNIQDKAQKIFKQGRSIASDNNLVTGLTIKLNNKGEIVDILVKSASGLKELDDAAIESFNQAGPFPNPPKGMLKNGKASIEWGFVVNT
jgi:protein TonB